jgi:ATP-dependent 26S proteasome regulatory subunit
MGGYSGGHHGPEHRRDTYSNTPYRERHQGTASLLLGTKLFSICIQVMRSETLRLQHEQSGMKEKIRDNGEKIKQNKVLPYLVGNVVEVGLTKQISLCNSLTFFIRFWMSTLRFKRTAQIRIWIQCAKENVLSSRLPPGKQSFFP